VATLFVAEHGSGLKPRAPILQRAHWTRGRSQASGMQVQGSKQAMGIGEIYPGFCDSTQRTAKRISSGAVPTLSFFFMFTRCTSTVFALT
jgi:hypothetical protein